MKPLDISEQDISIIQAHLRKQSALNKGRVDCLEWGCGGSTIAFPQFVQSTGGSVQYISVEHNSVWHARVNDELGAAGLGGCAFVHLEPSGDPMKEPMDGYVNYPVGLNRRWNFVFVDGRKRRRCLINASRLLAPGGVAILHDAERPWYSGAFRHFYKGEHVGDKLWVGRVDA